MTRRPSDSHFTGRWCDCGQAFNLEVTGDGRESIGTLITAAALVVERDQHGEPRTHFVIVASCPNCGRECTQEWAENLMTSAPEEQVYGRDSD